MLEEASVLFYKLSKCLRFFCSWRKCNSTLLLILCDKWWYCELVAWYVFLSIFVRIWLRDWRLREENIACVAASSGPQIWKWFNEVGLRRYVFLLRIMFALSQWKLGKQWFSSFKCEVWNESLLWNIISVLEIFIFVKQCNDTCYYL